MSQQVKTIDTIVLNKNEYERLEQALNVIKEDLAADLQHVIEENEDLAAALRQKVIEKFLLKVDYYAVDLSPYDKTLLYDINQGHWDIYRATKETKHTISIELEKPLNARSPLSDVKEQGVVAIDFGTKSTVAGLIDETSHKRLFRIGSGDTKSEQEKDDYENPTIVEFVNIERFKNAYDSCKSRPLTFWEDIRISHFANENLKKTDNEGFYRFFSNLKQWAGTTDNKFRIKDNSQSYTLKDFVKCEEGDLNPIEIYAYYIGRYINNMMRGIYLNYVLSFPVKYPQAVREKIRQSFERGIAKAIPDAVFRSEYSKQFKVQLSVSEPAAYAISALQAYGFYDKAFVDKKTFYGVFDFGGGTTDFDFGVWRGSEKSRYDFDIEHFGAGGDPYLGGEYLLEFLAYEIFKANKNAMRSKGCSFTKPITERGFGGDESLVQNSQEARKNTTALVEEIRPFWENIDLFRKEEEIVDEKISALKSGKLQVSLIDNDGKMIALELECNVKDLEAKLVERIDKGVENFYHTYKIAVEKMKGINKLHIFLGGNSSRSPLVKEAFERMMQKAKREKEDLDFELYPALGTPEAEEKRRELNLEEDTNDDLSTKITCKTGVVFGLLDGRKGGSINVISEVGIDDEAKFNFYLGVVRMKEFVIVLDKDKLDTVSGEWHTFVKCDNDTKEYPIYYTPYASATSGSLGVEEVKYYNISLDNCYENAELRIKITGPNTFRYGVWDEEAGLCYESEEILLSN
ncbi:hypothetical protein NYG93_06005 [Campylobacter felis]|uniref:hypothetical protein n=1 Tax=Campylobacter felis TaxID=2974565 RepID=UPI00256037C4|nr:hypothetical protein [Campylobacter felis]